MKTTLKSDRPSVLLWLCLFPILGALTVAQATPIGWYRMEGTSGDTITTVINSIGGGGAASNANAVGTITYSDVVAGPSIYDPVTDTLYANTTSMRIDGAASAYLQVNDGSGSGPLDVPDFTLEMFIRIDAVTTDYRAFVDHGGGSTDGWMLRSVIDGGERYPTGTIQNYNIYDKNGPIIDDGQWHHLAFVVQTSDLGGDNFARVYLDYGLLAESTGANLDTYSADVNAHMRIYADRYSGYGDEVRFSNAVLSPDDFLQVIPEPGTLSLLGMGLLAAFLARRRSIR